MHSNLVNGQAHGFTHATRGVKQGDLLSPTLFILSTKFFSRALNVLFNKGDFRGFGIPKWNSNLNHLTYADYTILFVSFDKSSLRIIK